MKIQQSSSSVLFLFYFNFNKVELDVERNLCVIKINLISEKTLKKDLLVHCKVLRKGMAKNICRLLTNCS